MQTRQTQASRMRRLHNLSFDDNLNGYRLKMWFTATSISIVIQLYLLNTEITNQKTWSSSYFCNYWFWSLCTHWFPSFINIIFVVAIVVKQIFKWSLLFYEFKITVLLLEKSRFLVDWNLKLIVVPQKLVWIDFKL